MRHNRRRARHHKSRFKNMSPSDLNNLRAQIEPTLAALEAERMRQMNKRTTTAFWCGGLALVGALVVAGIGNGVNIWMIAPLIFACIAYAALASGINNSYIGNFKQMVTPQLVKNFGDLAYSPDSGMSEAAFVRANLYGRPDRYHSEDLIEGAIGATRVQMSEVHAEDEQKHTDSKGHTTTTYTTIFRGLFVIADFNKNFNGTTYMVPEGLSGSLGGLGRGLQSLGGTLSGRGALVQLEDPNFERAFVVYSSDQIEARYLLSSSLMSRLMNLKGHFNSNISAAFIGGSLYLMIPKQDDWFEPPGLNTPLTFASVETILCQLQAATGIIEDLDLNTRIWSKQ